MAIFTASALAAFAWKALIASSLGLSVNSLLGNRFGNLFGGQGFKSDYDLEMDDYNKNQNTRTRTRGNFFNFNRRNQTTGQTRRDGILSFLGDRSRKLDDAPDIVEKNESVLSGIRTFGFSGLLPQSNPVPNIDNERISDPSYEGVRKEIDKINRNIEAISIAMLQGALLDEGYRNKIIEDMRKDLAEKGKDRSQTRSDRSIFNLLTRPQKQFKETAKSLSKGMSAAFGIGIGAAELFGMGSDLFGEDGGEENKKEDNKKEEGPPGSSDNSSSNNNKKSPTVGDYYRGKNRKYYILQSDGTFKKGSHNKPKEGRLFKKEDFGDVIEALKNVDTSNLEASFFTPITEEELERERKLDLGLNNTFESNPTFNDNSLISMSMADNYKPLEDMPRTNIFDLRSKKKGEDMTGAGQQVAGSGLETEIVTLSPEVGPSIWESFSRSIG